MFVAFVAIIAPFVWFDECDRRISSLKEYKDISVTEDDDNKSHITFARSRPKCSWVEHRKK